MATKRYVCKKCDRIREFDTRRKYIICPVCDSDLSCSHLWYSQVVGGTFYKGGFSYTEKKLQIPEGAIDIENGAFKDNWSIEEIIFPKTLGSISNNCFRENRHLKELVIPGNVKEIGWSSFENCSSLEKVIIEEGVEEISISAFSGCTNLKYVSLPSSLKKIGMRAFNNQGYHLKASNIKQIFLPKTIKEFGENAFGENTKDVCYFVSKGSHGEKYAKECGGTIIYANVTQGALLGSPVIDNTLYYVEKQSKKYVISKRIEKIAEYAFYGCEKIEELVIPVSVKEICAHAFSGAEKLSAVTFEPGSNLKCIGSKAFDSFQGTLIDLPASVEDVAPDAFPRGCIVSVGGEMLFYASSVTKLSERKKVIEYEKKKLANLNSNFDLADQKLQRHVDAFPNETKKIPKLEEELTVLTNERDTVIGNLGKEIELLARNISEIRSELDSLVNDRKRCFLLAFSKKKDLDANIEIKQNEVKSSEDILADKKSQLENVQLQFWRKIEPIIKKIDELTTLQAFWKVEKSNLTEERNCIEKEKDALAATVHELEEKLKQDEEILEKQHTKWLKKRNAEIERIEKQKQEEIALLEKKRLEEEERKRVDALLKEKQKLLADLVEPKYRKIPIFRLTSRKNIVEETLLNDHFLKMINDLNNNEVVACRNNFITSNALKIERIKEINKAVGFNEDYCISHLQISEIPTVDESYIPERFETLVKRYAKFDIWKNFKSEAKEFIQPKRKNKKTNIEDRFFGNVNSFYILHNDNKQLIVFPYCMAIFQKGEPLCVLTYDRTKISVEYTDNEEITDTVDEFGELIREQHKHLNKDGSVSHRYKENPIIKTVRYTTVTISTDQDSFTFPVHTYNDAVSLEQIFSAYCHDITTDLMGDVYKLVMQSSGLQEIESAIDYMVKEEARRRELELQKALEEQQRWENERKAVAEAAEKKRQAAIQRQRELNEERRRQSEEKKKALQLFEDDFAVEDQSEVNNQSQKSETLFFVVGNAVISNNVFKVVLKQLARSESKEFVAYFVSESEDIISNKKKLVSGEVDFEVTLGFVLDSGIDYTQMKKCFLMITTSSEDVQKIEFKMNISFYSDF